MKKIFICLTSAFLLAWIIALSIKAKDPKQIQLPKKPVINIQAKYEDLLKHLSTETVCPNLSPVHIFMQEEGGRPRLCATGGKFISTGVILTCAHAFWKFTGQEKKPCRYYYQILQPYEEKLHPIQSVAEMQSPEDRINWSRDMVTCIPGESQLIAGILPPMHENRLNGKQTFSSYSILKEKQPVRSTVTGETVYIIGSTKVDGGAEYFVLDYENFPSQSGTLFSSADHKVLYVLSAAMETNPHVINLFKLDPKRKNITLCSAVSVN